MVCLYKKVDVASKSKKMPKLENSENEDSHSSYRVSQKDCTTFDQMLKNSDLLNGHLVRQSFFRDFKILFDSRILQIRNKFIELQAFEVLFLSES